MWVESYRAESPQTPEDAQGRRRVLGHPALTGRANIIVPSHHPVPVSHDGAAREVLAFAPDLDALWFEHQVDVVGRICPGIPARLGGVPLASAAGASEAGMTSIKTASIMTTSRVSPKARRAFGLAVMLDTVRDLGPVASTTWLPFQVWVTGTRWTSPVGEAVPTQTLDSTASSFKRASALRFSGERAAMSLSMTLSRTECHEQSRASQ